MHPDAGNIASRAIDLSGLRVSSLLVPRSYMVTIAHDASTLQIRQLLKDSPHARYPVVGDAVDEVKGYVLARELYEQLTEGPNVDMASITRPIRYLIEKSARRRCPA